MQKLFYFSFILMLVLFSCKKESSPPPGPPVISFGSFTTSDKDHAVLTFNFTDPDGDIGLHQEDTSGSYAKGTTGYYDFYMRYYYLSPTTGNYTTYYRRFSSTPSPYIDSVIFVYRIPFVTNNIKSKTLDGQIIINLTGYTPSTKLDSLNHFRYEFWMYDRALHKSNVVTTPGFYTPY
jgi:hypothetical protein